MGVQSAEQKFKTLLHKSTSGVSKARTGAWGNAAKAPMMLRRPGAPVMRRNPFNGEKQMVIPRRKFQFIKKHAYSVAASGAMAHAYSRVRNNGATYRKFVPKESKICPALPSVSPAAKAILQHFLQCYAAEAATYARFVRKDATGTKPTSRINRKMMEVGIQIADSKIFDAARMNKTQLLAGIGKKTSKKEGGVEGKTSEKKAKKPKKAPAAAKSKKVEKVEKAGGVEKSAKISKPDKKTKEKKKKEKKPEVVEEDD